MSMNGGRNLTRSSIRISNESTLPPRSGGMISKLMSGRWDRARWSMTFMIGIAEDRGPGDAGSLLRTPGRVKTRRALGVDPPPLLPPLFPPSSCLVLPPAVPSRGPLPPPPSILSPYGEGSQCPAPAPWTWTPRHTGSGWKEEGGGGPARAREGGGRGWRGEGGGGPGGAGRGGGRARGGEGGRGAPPSRGGKRGKGLREILARPGND